MLALVAVARGSDDVLLREAAVAALGSLGDPAGREAVLAATTDVATVRRRAVLALAAFDGPEVEAALGPVERGPRPPGPSVGRGPAPGWAGGRRLTAAPGRRRANPSQRDPMNMTLRRS